MSVAPGVYDSVGNFSDSADMQIEAVYVRDWNGPLTNIDGTGTSLTAACVNIATKNRTPLVNIFPFRNPLITKNPNNFLDHVARGLYDANMRNIAAQMRAYGGPAYHRWGPEMDDQRNIGRYDWAVSPSQASNYVAAFQRRTSVFRSYTNNLAGQSQVWAPAGNANSAQYFPGFDFCDFIGCTAYGWELYQGDPGYDFGNVLGPKYGFLSDYGKSIIVETGCEAGDEQANWADQMRAAYNNFPLLSAVVWYNGRGRFPWVPTGPIPDWRTTPDVWHA